MQKATHGKMNSRVRGIFLSLEGNQTIRWGMGKEKKRKKIKENEERKGKEEKKKERRKTMHGGERKKKGSNSLCSDGPKSLVRELKLVYSTRATSRCQKQKM